MLSKMPCLETFFLDRKTKTPKQRDQDREHGFFFKTENRKKWSRDQSLNQDRSRDFHL